MRALLEFFGLYTVGLVLIKWWEQNDYRWLKFKRPKTLWDELAELEPGAMYVLTCRDSGNEFAILHLDDFDHVAEVGNMRRRNLQSIA
jgi:hypothetical protein